MITSATGYAHLSRLTDDAGLLEHARHGIARREHGYCTDDVARGLLITSRETHPTDETRRLSDCYLSFLINAQNEDGAFRNRLGYDRRWTDQPAPGDWWGRALWGLGTAAAGNDASWIRHEARAAFDRGTRQRCPAPHAMAFAGLGAAQILRIDPQDDAARQLLRDAAGAVGVPGDDPEWVWPWDRLTYANAALAEVQILAGQALDDPRLTARGLRMLSWLCRVQRSNGRLSPISAHGWRRGEPRERFDQQPIEVAALADACATAAVVSGDRGWDEMVVLAVEWFGGRNDGDCPMWDAHTGGGYDGLTPDGPNLNQGAESTLAFISTAQHASRLALAGVARG